MTRPLSDAALDDLASRLPADRPFVGAEADDLGVSASRRRLLVRRRRLRTPLPGVFCLTSLPDTLEHRLGCLALVVPSDCVVTDRTAAWVWVGDRALAPGEHRATPLVSVFAPPGRRLRNGLSDSGERRLRDEDVVSVGGLQVTVPLRTACDQGRLLHVDQAFAAMDSLATLRVFTVDDLVEELDRYRGYRGIVQARTWAPYVDAGSDSQFESVARRRWLVAGLPRPRCQCPETSPSGGTWWIDIGLPGERFGAEYFGDEFHGEAEAPYDERRLDWLRRDRGWVLVVARSHHVVGPRQNLEQVLRARWQQHRSTRPVVLT